jgi:hypothetical protein
MAYFTSKTEIVMQHKLVKLLLIVDFDLGFKFFLTNQNP